MDDLLQRDGFGKRQGQIGRDINFTRHAAPGQLGCQQVQRLLHRGGQRHRLRVAGQVRALHQPAQAPHDVGGAAGLLHALGHRGACGVQVGRGIAEQALRRLGAGQQSGQWLVQLVCHARRQLAQGVEPRHLAQPQQLFGAQARLALVPERANRHERNGAAQHPAQHCQPGQLAPGDDALGQHVERLAGRCQRFAKLVAPTARGNAPRLEHQRLSFVFEHHAHRAGFRVHRPLGPGHGGLQVQKQRIADGIAGLHQPVAPGVQISSRKLWAAQLA